MFLVEACQGAIEPQRFVHRFLYESLHRAFAEEGKHLVVEAATETFHPRETDPFHGERLAIEDVHAIVVQDLADQFVTAFFEIVVPQHRKHGHGA